MKKHVVIILVGGSNETRYEWIKKIPYKKTVIQMDHNILGAKSLMWDDADKAFGNKRQLIIWNQENLKIQDRKRILSRAPEFYYKVAGFFAENFNGEVPSLGEGFSKVEFLNGT